ncbi:Na(+)/H(+) antiporter subunit B [Roseomonas populi]|uniref:DUF4040 domain-containing protein n=1 Tax=Roseomonas populi TaxID=3121582 RepID=A0ABT1WZG4_9PROT|nr:DUF4040 domain-containing protein [Roseomonas pecuniae]MCR0981235.1 DUF4040 domain-containing protein [Roseomonas pecuniae]
MTPLLAGLLLLVAATGAGVVLTRQPRRQVMAMAANGLALTVLFTALQAPDVAFSQLVVGTAAVPLLFLAVLASIRLHRPEEKE